MILLVANSRDFATDYVVARLQERKSAYLRLDLDLLDHDRVFLDPVRQSLRIESREIPTDLLADEIRSILFRAPTHLRESSGSGKTPEKLLARHQWAAFSRSLMVWDRPLWINHPRATFQAENKPYQLMVAARLGLSVPRTIIANAAPAAGDGPAGQKSRVAVKALDSFLLRLESEEDAFFYTELVTAEELTDAELSSMPVIIQQCLDDKIDLRVTVVGEECFVASVLVDGAGIRGDWRLAKDKAHFGAYELPDIVRSRCVALVKELGLVFGAIDLAKVGDEFYFLEINPTGEWAWLVSQCRMPIDRAITDALSR